MALFNSGNKEQKQKKKQAEKILDEIVGGLMPTRTRLAFFSRMTAKGIKPRQQEKVRLTVLKTVKSEVENNELEPTLEDINQRIEQILNENSDQEVLEKRRENHEMAVQKAKNKKIIKKTELEEKFGIDLTDKQWFQCSIEEVKYSTFTNQPQRNIDTAYVIINKDNFEIIKESVWLKTNMGTRKLFFYNITSIDYDARGVLHASSSVIINTKSAEHVQLKFVTRENFDLMNNAFESFLDKIHNPPQTAQVQENVSTTSSVDELLKFAELYEKGLLTKEEFEMKKAELLGINNEVNPDENHFVKQEFIEENNVNNLENQPKFCSECGSSIDNDSNFCPNCGAKLI
ncbi:zinc-ribbon domain-containing protein [Methanobrevibacter sp.]|uniref:zinc-ribbon domain-containing protein n=1 Tax=Methanobrevibacter sp. TaxID=66852 RepID=UPI00388DDC93